jgi:hypothetical protein
MQDLEMKRLEGGAGPIGKVISTIRPNAFALKRLPHPRRIQLRNLGVSFIHSFPRSHSTRSGI